MIEKYKGQRRILSAIVVLFWFAQYVYIPQQTPYLTGLAVSSSFIGLIVGCYGFTQMIVRTPLGILADSANRHKLFIIIGAVCSGTASLIRIISPVGMGFMIANLFSGLASGMWVSYMVQFTSYYDKDSQQKGTGHIVMYNNIGMLAAFICSSVFYDAVGMKYICLMSSLAGALAVILGLFLKSPEDKGRKDVTVRELLSVCKGKRLIVFALLQLLQQGIQMSTTMSFTTQVMKDLGGTAVVIGVASVIYMGFSVLTSMFASTKICAKLGPKGWVPIVFTCVGIYCLLVPLCTSVWQIFPLQLIPGLSTGILASYNTSEAMVGVPREKRSTAMGFFQSTYAMGMTVIPMIMGAVAQNFSMMAGFYMLGIMAFVGTVGSLGFYRKITF